MHVSPHKVIQYSGEDLEVKWEMYFDTDGDFLEVTPQKPQEVLPDTELQAIRTILHETYAGNEPGETVKFDEATTQQLEALGYF